MTPNFDRLSPYDSKYIPQKAAMNNNCVIYQMLSPNSINSRLFLQRMRDYYLVLDCKVPPHFEIHYYW